MAAPPRWIFGYGSLLWRREFPSGPPRVASIEGWERRLDQGSPDHRGTPMRLGRVATLVPHEGARCHGAVFELVASEAEAVLAHLDDRERGGYVRADLAAELRDPHDGARTITAVTWVARADNPYYLGPSSPDAMVAQICAAHGPSGSNIEYVLRLAETLRAMGIEDPHVFEIERALHSKRPVATSS